MRTYDQLVSAIAAAVLSAEEIATLTDEQIQTLRKHGNCFENVLYMHTREWKEWRAQNLPQSL